MHYLLVPESLVRKTEQHRQPIGYPYNDRSNGTPIEGVSFTSFFLVITSNTSILLVDPYNAVGLSMAVPPNSNVRNVEILEPAKRFLQCAWLEILEFRNVEQAERPLTLKQYSKGDRLIYFLGVENKWHRLA